MKRLSFTVEMSVVALFFVLMVALFWASASRSAEAAPAWRTPRPWLPPRSAFATPGRAGMIVGRDTDTGVLGLPDAEQRAKYAPALEARASAARPAPVYRLDGSVSMDTRSWMREFSYVRVIAPGKHTLGCLDDRAAAVRAMHAPLPAAAAAEER